MRSCIHKTNFTSLLPLPPTVRSLPPARSAGGPPTDHTVGLQRLHTSNQGARHGRCVQFVGAAFVSPGVAAVAALLFLYTVMET